MVEMERSLPQMRGSVKWFDPGKGFGFIVADEGGPDILLHANALRSYGQSTVCDGAAMVVRVQQTARGLQAVEVIEIVPPAEAQSGDEDGQALPAEYLTLPLEPARVKWFDKAKGFGFGNVFGRGDDAFIHMEALRRSGFADLQPGEAVALRIVDGERGRLAVMIAPWEAALREEATEPPSGD